MGGPFSPLLPSCSMHQMTDRGHPRLTRRNMTADGRRQADRPVSTRYSYSDSPDLRRWSDFTFEGRLTRILHEGGSSRRN